MFIKRVNYIFFSFVWFIKTQLHSWEFGLNEHSTKEFDITNHLFLNLTKITTSKNLLQINGGPKTTLFWTF